MPNRNDSLIERVGELLPSLAATAANLNNASKELTKVIERLDGALQRLNLGVPAWVELHGHSLPDNSTSWSEELGYSKIERKWGLTLRKTRNDHFLDEFEVLDAWPFNEAPRDLRLRALGKIPKLLKELDRVAQMMAEEISESIDGTVTLAKAIEESAPPQRAIKGQPGRGL